MPPTPPSPATSTDYPPPPNPALSPEALDAWRALFGTHRRMVREVERRLAAAELPPSQWYEVLYALRAAPEQRLLHHQLADATMLSRSGLSRLVDRMESKGVIARADCPGDRRSGRVVLTGEGEQLMVLMWPYLEAPVAEHFGPAVEGSEATIRDALAATSESLDGACDAACEPDPPCES